MPCKLNYFKTVNFKGFKYNIDEQPDQEIYE